jgi:hypothetical protein
MITPEVAHNTYTDAERSAAQSYRDYWIERFKQFGLFFHPGPYGYGHEAVYNGLKVDLWIDPHRFQGAKLTVHFPATPTPQGHNSSYCRNFKIVAESGLRRLMNKFKNGF